MIERLVLIYKYRIEWLDDDLLSEAIEVREVGFEVLIVVEEVAGKVNNVVRYRGVDILSLNSRNTRQIRL